MDAPTPVSPAPQEEETLVERGLDQLDCGSRAVRRALGRIVPEPVKRGWTALGAGINRLLPKGLLGRSLLIIVMPMIVLLSVLAFVFMDRHWELVTARLSNGMVRDIAAMVDVIEAQPAGADLTPVLTVAATRLQIKAEIGPPEDLASRRTAYFGLLDRTLSSELTRQIGRPFSLDSLESRGTIQIRLPIDRGTLFVSFPRNLAYAANWHFFLVWMVTVALVLIVVSVVFIRNQIKPIQRLAKAAEAFGKGRPVAGFSPQGAREVRKAAHAFIAMRRRIERQIETRTTMLAGVSHDLRTVLTRFRLELALQPDTEETEAMRRDVDEMEAMLEAYMAFAKGDVDEEASEADVRAILADVAERSGDETTAVTLRYSGEPMAVVRPGAFRRLVGNLVGNALRYGNASVQLAADHRDGWLSLTVDDDGPGIPEAEREAVFKPFYRLDQARNQDLPGTGLGLAIARDVARSHGGEVRLEDSPLGGLRAVVRLPV